MREGYDPAYGARPLKRTIQRLRARPAGAAGARGRVPRRRHACVIDADGGCARRSDKAAEAQPVVTIGTVGSLATHNPRYRVRASGEPGERRQLPGRGRRSRSGTCSGCCWCSASRRPVCLTPAGRQIPYSEFKALVRSGQVVEVDGRRSDDPRHAARGTGQGRAADRPLRRPRASRIPKLVEDLEAHQVKYSGETVSRWLPEVLGWIIPLRAPRRRLELLLPPHRRRRRRRHVVRAQPREDLRRRRREGAASPTSPAWTKRRRSCARSSSS